MSNFLAVDTSSRYLTVVAYKDGVPTLNHISDCAMRHSVILMDEIDKTLNEAQLAIADCDYFVAVTGPGSFTGIRIGISCVKGFATALSKKAVGVTAFDVLSYNINSDCEYLVAIDASHNHYYICGYNKEGEQDIEPKYVSYEELVALSRPVYGFENLPLPSYSKVEMKDCLVKAGLKCRDKEGLSALYVRKSQAEEERNARLNRV
ncbi:MAG: tRNA (adenosine(37)-N6)-threonylcarbamoyltransferase complex dimerization subunit type 1 TsaB [Candidatus Coproplasma sp.]